MDSLIIWKVSVSPYITEIIRIYITKKSYRHFNFFAQSFHSQTISSSHQTNIHCLLQNNHLPQPTFEKSVLPFRNHRKPSSRYPSNPILPSILCTQHQSPHILVEYIIYISSKTHENQKHGERQTPVRCTRVRGAFPLKELSIDFTFYARICEFRRKRAVYNARIFFSVSMPGLHSVSFLLCRGSFRSIVFVGFVRKVVVH